MGFRQWHGLPVRHCKAILEGDIRQPCRLHGCWIRRAVFTMLVQFKHSTPTLSPEIQITEGGLPIAPADQEGTRFIGAPGQFPPDLMGRQVLKVHIFAIQHILHFIDREVSLLTR